MFSHAVEVCQRHAVSHALQERVLLLELSNVAFLPCESRAVESRAARSWLTPATIMPHRCACITKSCQLGSQAGHDNQVLWEHQDSQVQSLLTAVSLTNIDEC